MMKLRPLQEDDAMTLFNWRNNPSTFENFRNPRPITKDSHLIWMQVMMNSTEHRVQIAEWITKEMPYRLGVIHFADRDRGCEVGITVSPHFRGLGHGYRILKLATQDAEIPLLAEIKRTNSASKRIFEQCGFLDIGGDTDFALYRKDA